MLTVSNASVRGSTDSLSWVNNRLLRGETYGATVDGINKIYTVSGDPGSDFVLPNDDAAQNAEFEKEANTFLDFSEHNPFGEVGFETIEEEDEIFIIPLPPGPILLTDNSGFTLVDDSDNELVY